MKFLNAFLLTSISALCLAACSSFSLTNPFGQQSKEISTAPANATEYVCEGNKRFYVRMLNNGNDAWLIYPDHEVNLVKNGSAYTSGSISLNINGDATTLNDGEKIAYSGCKAQTKSK